MAKITRDRQIWRFEGLFPSKGTWYVFLFIALFFGSAIFFSSPSWENIRGFIFLFSPIVVSFLVFNRRLKITCDRHRGEIQFEGQPLFWGKWFFREYRQTVRFDRLQFMVQEAVDSYGNHEGYDALVLLPDLPKPNGGFAWGFAELTRSRRPTAAEAERDLERLQQFFTNPWERFQG